MFILNLLVLFILSLVFIWVINRYMINHWLGLYYTYTNSNKYNAEKDFRLMNTIVAEQAKEYVERFVLGGSMDRDNIKLAIIPATNEGILEHITEIYQIVNTKLSPNYIRRLGILYIAEIDQYIYIACKTEYLRLLSEIKSTKRVIARDELNNKEINQIKEIYETLDEFNSLEYDPFAIESLYDQFKDISSEDMLAYENSSFESIQENTHIYKTALNILKDKKLDPKTFFDFIHKQRGE